VGRENKFSCFEHGSVVRDCHAEVLVRRSLVKILCAEIEHFYSENDNKNNNHEQEDDQNLNHRDVSSSPFSPSSLLLLEPISSHECSSPPANDFKKPNFFLRLKPDCFLHLYITEPPCGEASIYDRFDFQAFQKAKQKQKQKKQKEEEEKEKERERKEEEEESFVKKSSTRETGAKKPEEGNTERTGERRGRRRKGGEGENSQASKANTNKLNSTNSTNSTKRASSSNLVRLKSGRREISESKRTASMSCSDKICRWNELGLQGGLLGSNFLPQPICFSTLCVGAQAVLSAMEDLPSSCQMIRDYFGSRLKNNNESNIQTNEHVTLRNDFSQCFGDYFLLCRKSIQKACQRALLRNSSSFSSSPSSSSSPSPSPSQGQFQQQVKFRVLVVNPKRKREQHQKANVIAENHFFPAYRLLREVNNENREKETQKEKEKEKEKKKEEREREKEREENKPEEQRGTKRKKRRETDQENKRHETPNKRQKQDQINQQKKTETEEQKQKQSTSNTRKKILPAGTAISWILVPLLFFVFFVFFFSFLFVTTNYNVKRYQAA